MTSTTRRIENLAMLAELVGQEVGVSDWRRISQADIDAFALGTGDDQWIHVDPERAARESPFGVAIAHGFLTISLLPRLMFDSIDLGGISLAINYGLNKVRLPAPVPVGSRLRAHFSLVSLEPAGTAVQAIWQCTVEREGGDKPVCVAEWLMRYVPASG
ncbi:MaoC family dehydratase [Xanthomonadaceae bacterium JHOS43]|nr:MaoC family dehydratase [Xanthomonadaceae bacterium JHOS43]